MPRFFFDVQDGRSIHRDEFGAEFDSAEAASGQARALLPDLARNRLPSGPSHDFAVTVRDADGAVVHRASLAFRSGWTGRAAPAAGAT